MKQTTKVTINGTEELDKLVERIGKNLMEGALTAIAWSALRIVCYAVITYLICNWAGWGTDDSDISGWNRSGFKVMTDHKTGIQYLSDGHGGLIERKKVPAEQP
jgi:hypothetical protein